MTISKILRAVLNVTLVASAAAGLCWFLLRLGRRSGVSQNDLGRALPGDDLVSAPHLLADRAATIDAPPERVWPWLVQMGKGRAGWYMPIRLERWLPASWRGARGLQPAYQSVRVGDLIPDYGPGDGQFKAMWIEPPRVLVYYSVRQPSADWTWPDVDNPLPEDALALSWALILEPLASDRTRLHIRLRADPPGRKTLAWPMRIIAGIVDWLTIALLFRGLNERLRPPGGPLA
jgi:hypothetical protein